MNEVVEKALVEGEPKVAEQPPKVRLPNREERRAMKYGRTLESFKVTSTSYRRRRR